MSQTNEITRLENIDSVMNFVYEDDIYGRMGILETAGDAVKEEYDINRVQKQLPFVKYGVVMTGAGNLHYKAIFHVQVFKESAKFKEAFYRALLLADKKEMRSIAIPSLECTVANKEFVDGYLQVIYEFEKRANPICLHNIDIYPSAKEDRDYLDSQTTVMGEKLL